MTAKRIKNPKRVSKMISKSKYRAKRTEVDGIMFASGKEARRYVELKALERAGEIVNLELQPSFEIVINEVKICTYKADFKYVKLGALTEVVEDVKGFLTPVYRLKKKLMKAWHGIEIKET